MKYIQKGYLHYILIVTALFMLFPLGYRKPGGNTDWILGLVLLVLVLIILSSYQLTLELCETELKFKAGIGLFKKTIPYDIIASSSIESSSFWSGIGIRFIGKGWLYNIKFGKALEIKYKNKTMVTQFGFDEAEEIAKELNNRLASFK